MNFELPDNWFFISDDKIKSGLIDEAYGEMSLQHELHEKLSYAIAKCKSNDDVLFELINGDYAIIHLTWNGNESDPSFPTYKVCIKENIDLEFFIDEP